MTEDDDEFDPAPFVKLTKRRVRTTTFNGQKRVSDPDPVTSCHGKPSYPTMAAALKRLSYGRMKHRQAYRCRHCHQFHVGSDLPNPKE